MAARSVKTSPKAPPVTADPAKTAGELDLVALAEGVLARSLRPRAADVRRLAEAVLEAARKPAKKKKKKADKKPRGKKRKLSKIPGQGKKA